METKDHAAPAPSATRPWAVLTLLCTAQFVDVLGVTVVVVALPAVRADLGLAPADASWVVSAYALAFGCLLLTSGRAADRYGRRRLFTLGLCVFAGASLLCGATTMPIIFLLGRAAQGVGAALMVPAALASLVATFPAGPARSRALGIWTATAATGGAAGFMLGGVVTEHAGWRWLFLGNIPIGLAGLIAAYRLLPGSAPASSGSKGPGSKGSGSRGSIDLQGSLSATGAAALLIHGFARAETLGFTRPEAWSPIAVAAVLIVWFVRAERRAEDPLIPGSLVRSPHVVGALIVTFVLTAATSSAAILASVYFQDVRDMTAGRTGLLLLPFSLAVVAGSALGGALSARGRETVAAAGGLAVIAGALLCASRIDAGHGTFFVLAGMILSGAGLGCASVAATATGIRGVPQRRHGVISGLLNSTAQIGTAAGVACLVALATTLARRSALPGDEAVAWGLSYAFLAAAFAVAAALLVLAVAHRRWRRVIGRWPGRGRSPIRGCRGPS